MLQRLPSSGGGLNGKFNNSGNLGNPPDGGGVGAGSAEIDLRYLTAKRTLVLVDGMRYVNGASASGIPSTVDLNTIITSSIDRIEVLQSGQSPLYGSDALSGVVNVITKASQSGLQASALMVMAPKKKKRKRLHGERERTGYAADDLFYRFPSSASPYSVPSGYTVVGVMPPWFRGVEDAADLWIPLMMALRPEEGLHGMQDMLSRLVGEDVELTVRDGAAVDQLVQRGTEHLLEVRARGAQRRDPARRDDDGRRRQPDRRAHRRSGRARWHIRGDRGPPPAPPAHGASGRR